MSAARREALLQAFAGYRAADSRDDEAASRFRRFVQRADPFRRNDPDGHVTASAVVARSGNVAGTGPAGLHPPQNFEFLLVFHRKLDRWLQPGGHVEPDDASVFETAVREAREETGVGSFAAPLGDTILDLDVHPIPAFGNEPAHVHYDVRFLLTTEDAGALAPGAAWFARADVAGIDRDGSLSRAVRKVVLRLPPP
ncbi:MAG TPA: NUDIX domain-containing protein [Thermoanaerobaculia bacterium]